MSGADPRETSNANGSSSSAPASFEELLARARALYESSDLDGAREILLELEKRYIAATPLFELAGNVLIRQGDFRKAVRYKTLYEMLCAALDVQRRSVCAGSDLLPIFAEREGLVEKRISPPRPPEEDVTPPVTHLTEAMGQELMRQGHFAQALRVFNVLVEKYPDDHGLRSSREKARKKARERQVVGILEGWLDKLQRMTAN